MKRGKLIDTMAFDTLIVVSKAIWDNLPFTDPNFKADSVNALVPTLKGLLEHEQMGKDWIASVYQAQSNNQPVYIDYNGEFWTFYTMGSGSRDDLILELKKVGKMAAKGKIKFQHEKEIEQ